MNQDEFNKIISEAIGAEAEAFAFYSTVSEKAKDANLKNLFKDLAEEEAKHKRTLEGYLAKGAGKIHFSASADYKVVDSLPTPPPSLPILNRSMGWSLPSKKSSKPCRSTPNSPKQVRTKRRKIFFWNW